MEAIEVFDIARVTMGDAVLMQAIWQGSFLDWAAFLLAVLTNHENRIRVLIFSIESEGLSQLGWLLTLVSK